MDFEDILRRQDERVNSMKAEVARLSQDIKLMPKVGQRVVVAIGLLSHAHEWIKAECTVIEVGNISIKIKCEEGHHDFTEWIDPALIIELLKETQ